MGNILYIYTYTLYIYLRYEYCSFCDFRRCLACNVIQLLGHVLSVLLRFVQTFTQFSFVYLKRYFTALSLSEKLKELNIYGTGTIMANHITDCYLL